MTVTPLITASEMFPALERLVDDARTELSLSFRIFDPTTRLRDPDLVAGGLETWSDLLSVTVQRGVRLRLIQADFDAVLAPGLHRLAWRSVSQLADRLTGDVQILCSPHGHVPGRYWTLAMRSYLEMGVAALRHEDPTRLTPIQRAVLKSGPILRPVTLHQKFAVADAARAIIGGIDVNERRFDTPAHDRGTDETWHDVSVGVVDEDFCGALRGHFDDTWNAALDAGAASLAEPARRADAGSRPQAPPDLRLIRTVSAPARGFFRLSPQPRTRDHERVIPELIGAAQRHIYAETQYFRHPPIADALVAAAGANSGLQLVLILPAAPDRVLYDGVESWYARHAHGVQHALLKRIASAFGDRAAIIAPAQPWSDSNRIASHEGAGPVYIHAKVLITDDTAALVGSANLNGRSMRWDTEASVLFRQSDAVAQLHSRLAEKWLGPDADGDTTLASTWTRSAEGNAAKPPDARRGYVLPFPMQKSEAFSRRIRFLPNDMF